MKRILKIAGICGSALIVVLIVVPFFVPVNRFRPTIEEQASRSLGRKVQIGDLSLSLLTGSVSAQNLSIADDPKFSGSAFLQARSVKIGVRIMPLIFSKSLEVTGVTIENPEVTLLQNAQGQWNYSSLGGAQQAGSSSAPAPSFLIQRLSLKDGRIGIGSASSQKRNIYDHVEVETSNVSMTSNFPVTVTASLPGGGTFKLTGSVGPVNSGNASLTPLNAKLEVSGLNLASTGFLDPSAGLGGVLDVDASLSSQNGTAETQGTAKLAKALLVAGGSPAAVPLTVNFDTRYDLTKNTGVLNPSTVTIGNAVAHLSGAFQTSGDATAVNLKLNATGMPATDLESFLPAVGLNLPQGAKLQAGTLDASLDVSGPTNNPVISGNAGLFAAKLTGFDLGSKMSAISSLAGIKTGNDLEIEKMTTDLHVATNGIRVDNFLAVVPAIGTLAGAGTVDAKNQLDFKMAATITSGVGAVAAPVSSIAGMVGKATGKQSGCKNGTTVPFQVQGTMSDPKFVPDVGGLAAGMFKSQLGCLGNAASGVTKSQKASSVVNGVTGLFGKKKQN
ncbi:MAG: AsmA family protein [Terracidiphilus sp.]